MRQLGAQLNATLERSLQAHAAAFRMGLHSLPVVLDRRAGPAQDQRLQSGASTDSMYVENWSAVHHAVLRSHLRLHSGQLQHVSADAPGWLSFHA